MGAIPKTSSYSNRSRGAQVGLIHAQNGIQNSSTHASYETILATKGSFMGKFDLGITDASKRLCRILLEAEQSVPQDTQRGVTGIAQWFHHEQVSIDEAADTIANLRGGLEFSQLRKISAKASWVDSGTESGRADSKMKSNPRRRSKSSVRRLTSLAINTRSSSISSSRQKRKQDKQLAVETSPTKRYRSNDSQSVPRHMEQDAKEDESHKSNTHSIKNLTWQDTPSGRFRKQYIITEPAAEGDPRGRLINLDLAKELDTAPSEASHQTGTMRFMAIEVLKSKGHTYRHNLESFFYVFIWMCIRYGHKDTGGKGLRPTRTSILRGWYTGTYAEIANVKLGHMVGFELITAEFSPEFSDMKDLAEAKDRSISQPRFGTLHGNLQRSQHYVRRHN
ncbi:hypothetical protein B7463_g12284, partial [Scytalidium lignicola]